MDEQPTVITMRSGRAELGVAPGVGGAIVHYRWVDGDDAHEWLRPSTAADVASGNADRLAAFALVPFSNRIRDGRFEFEGRSIVLPLNQWPQRHSEHGHGWQAAWTLIERSAARLSLEYNHAADHWPFPYRAVQDFELTDEALTVTLSVENQGTLRMPVGLGLHPYFPRTPRCRLSAEVDAMWATDAEVMPTTLTVADPRLGEGRGLPVAETSLDNAFTGWRGRAAITWPERRAHLAIDADPPLRFLVVYSPSREEFFCAEPVSHCTDAFNLAAQGRRDTGMLTLDPGARLSAKVSFRPRLE
jgi:aldose 1-epimerase